MANEEIVDQRPEANRIVEFMVQATEFELRYLRETWKPQVFSWDYAPKALGLSELNVLGSVAGFPIAIAITWLRIDGHIIGFYRPASRLVDYEMIERWIDARLAPPKGGGGTCRITAANFETVIGELGIRLKPTHNED